MILADKIIRLRKKNGWSQEELAAKMNVSRQAVSKWEGAQTIPDLEKILLMSDLFGVTTDYLLKDNMENEEFTEDVPNSGIKRVSIEEANAYIEHRKWASRMIAIATFLCIFSPIALIILTTASEFAPFKMSPNVAVVIGLVVLFFAVTVAVGMYVYCGFKNVPYEYLDKAVPFELEYGVIGMVKEKQKAFREKYTIYNVIATCLCVFSPVPVILGAFTGNEFLVVIFLGVTMVVAGIGVSIFILYGVRWASMQKLLKEGEYSLVEKKRSGIKDAIALVYWLVLTVVYLVWSFATNDWEITWIVFAVGGVLFVALMEICNLFVAKE